MNVGVGIEEVLKDYMDYSDVAYSQFLRLPASEKVSLSVFCMSVCR